ncbi:MAG: histidine--tRNA ligase [Eggerthellaceae bacterium]|nr:histidine--tRNA ligase [Eggerthellaceae bacterium]
MTITAPEGTRDLLFEESFALDEFKRIAFSVFEKYGYEPIETPIMEQTDLFVRGIGSATDVVSKEMFTAISGENFKRALAGESIKEKSRLSLRPEGTAGVVRAVVQNDLVPQGASPAKLMYAGPMFRAERPQKGRQRQFNQVGIECLGADAPSVDAEAVIMLMEFYRTIGIPADAMTLYINSMGCEHCRPAYRDAVRAYMDEHKGELCETCIERMDTNPLRAFDCKNDKCASVMDKAPKITDYLCDDCKGHYAEFKAYLTGAGIVYKENPRLVRGLDYYTRSVFEVQAACGLGSQNAIGGGGRYDKLALEIGGRDIPGLGFAIGFERCMLALEAAGASFKQPKTKKAFVACVDESVRDAAFALTQACRKAGIIADEDHQRRSLKSQLKLADKWNADFVVIIGPDEFAVGKATLRNMDTHEETQLAIDDIPAAIRA